jgi:hypothetical protein
VTWTSSGISVSLSAQPSTSGSETVTATASIDVGPTPYYIEIFDIETGLVTRCPSGTTCTATFTPAVGVNHLVAFVAGFGTTLLPPNIQAESAIVVTTGFPPPPG